MRAMSDLVSTTSLRDLGAAAPQFTVKHAAACDLMVATQNVFQLVVNVLHFDGGEKTEATQVGGKQRRLATGSHSRAGGAEQRTVATQNNQEFRFGGDIFT
jgi:hypothetical protein